MARADPRPNYGTKRRVRDDGYIDVYMPTHPIARRDGYVFEHRKMAWDAGILTDPADEVHHRNEVRNDNRLENFQILTGTQHALQHAEERGYVRNQYGKWLVKPRDERQSAPRPTDRSCAGCEDGLPPSLRRDALYCSNACRIRAWKRNKRRR